MHCHRVSSRVIHSHTHQIPCHGLQRCVSLLPLTTPSTGPFVSQHRNKTKRPLVALIITIFSFCASIGHAQVAAGLQLERHGVHFRLPFGCELSTTEVRGHDGPVNLIIIEPIDGQYQSMPNSAFLSVSVFDFPIAPDMAIDRVVFDLRSSFEATGEFNVSDTDVEFGGVSRDGLRLDFTVVDVALVGYLAAFRQGDQTVLVFMQGRTDELELIRPLFQDTLDSVSFDPPDPEGLVPLEPGPNAGTGEGTH